MLRILNKNQEPVQGLDRYKQLRITKRLNLDDKTLEFSALVVDIAALENEGYIETETDRFVIKEITPSSDGTANVLAQLDVESLEGKTFIRFETVEKTLPEAMALAFAGTGWTVGTCEITKKRTLRKEHCTSYDMLKQALSVYRCECVIDSKNQTVSFYEQRGSDKGVYFMSDLNLRSMSLSRTSYEFYTEIEPYGADGMTIEEVNDGSKVLTNYTYSSKKKRIIWKDDRYSVPESLMEDAQAKLNDYSKPYTSYMADVVDLASMSEAYSILEYDIGDTVTLMDNATGTREQQRIVEMVVYPEEPELNSCVFANVTLTFEELAMKFSETADTVDNITLDNGTIDGSKINSFDAQKLSNFDTVLAASGVFGTLVANHAAFEEATVNRFQTNEANITTLQTNYADVAIAKIGVLETNYGSIRTLLAGNTAVEEAQMINLTANNAKINEAFLKSVIAASITVNDLKAGTIYTNKHTVQSEDGAMVMDGSVLTFKDANDVVRIQIGKDGQGNYNYYLTNADGDIIWDAAGLTKDGVPDGLIVDDMVADSSATYSGISASKLNIHSMVGALNSEGGLSSSSIVMDEDNQSLTVAFTNMKESVDSLSKGGRNLMLNTLVPNTAESDRMRINGQTSTTRSSGSFTVATHGLCCTVSDAICPYIRFGSNSVSDGTMNGLEAGETYTISFDGEWKLYSGDTYDATRYFQVTLYGAKDGGSTFVDSIADKNKKRIPITASEKGQPMSCRYEWTFTVPDNVVKAYLIIRPNMTTSRFFAVGDYIKIENVKLEKGSVATPWSPAPEDYLAETAKLNDLIDGIQDQIDGVIDTYYYDYAPTLSNVPASGWAVADYPSHKGDMFLDTSTGKSYRFLQDETTQAWSWVEIPDTASAAALVAAQNALDVADHKRRVFVDTPSAPYDVGDLWFTGAGGDILTCTTAKTKTQQYAEADWSKLHKYTDNSYAETKYSELNTTIEGITGRVGTLETTTTTQGQTIESHTTTINQTANKINRIITDSQIAELDTGTSMFDKLLSVEETADGVKTDVTSLKTWKDNATGQITNLESQQNTFEQNLTGTTSRVSNIEKDYLTTSAAQTLINQSAESVTISVNKTIDGIKVGGRNLIINTLDPDVSAAAKYPRLVGQTVNTAFSAGTWTVAEHGIRNTNKDSRRTIIRFGTTNVSASDLLGLEAGKTYTFSCDASWRLYSGDNPTTTVHAFRVNLYDDTKNTGTFALDQYFEVPIEVSQRGTEMSARVEFTFTIPENATIIYIQATGSNGTAAYYGAGDYIELRNLKLEKGNKATDWTAAPEDYAGKGEALNNVAVEYAVGDSPSTAPSSGWSTDSPTWTQGKYIWQRTAITKNGQTAYSNTSCIQGAKGDAGETVSILSTEIRYQEHTSGTSVPTGTWKTEVPTVAQGAYLWTRTIVNYSDGTSTTSYSVGRMGSNGQNGQNGQNGTSPTVTSTVTKYQQSQNGTTAPTGTWETTPPTATAGQFMWTQTTVTYSDGATSVSYAVSKNGTNGVGITNIEEYYVCTNSTTAPADSEFSTGIKTPTEAKPYLWNFEKVTYTDRNTKNLDKHIVAMYGKVGADGRSITGIKEYYKATNSTTAPTSGWFDTVQTVTATNKYLWNYEVVSYSTGDPDTTDPRIIGVYGDKGDKGDTGDAAYTYDLIASHAAIVKGKTGSLSPSAITFTAKRAQGTGNPANYTGRFKIETTADNSTWTARYTSEGNESVKAYTIPSGTIAVRCSLYLAGGTTTLLDQQTIPVVSDGVSGDDAYTVVLTNESHTFAAGTSAAVAGTATSKVVAYKGASQASCYAGASASATSVSTGVTGLTCAITNNNSTNVTLTFTATTSLTTKSGTVTIPVVVDSKTFNKVFSWSLALSGQNGAPGAKGDTGVGISKVTPQYCWHTSNSSAPTTGWSSEKIAAPDGKPYLWIRSMIDYNDGTSEPTDATCDMTLNDLQTRMSSAEQKITADAIISTVAMTYGIADANLIYNSTGYGKSTDGWELSNTSLSYELYANYNSTRPGKTDYALCLAVKTTSSTTVVMRQTQAHWITVEQGKSYTLSGFYYRSANVRTPCYVGLEYSTDGGTTWNTASYSTYGVTMDSASVWTAFSKTFKAPSNLMRVGVKASGSSSASSNYMVYVSDLVLVRGETAMPWAESPTSLIEQTSEMIRLKAEKLVWTANNSSLTETGELTVTKGNIGGFSIDSTAIFTNSKDSTSNGSILISKSDVARTVAGKYRESVRFAIGQNLGVVADGTLIAKNVDLTGAINATSGSIGGIKISTTGIYTEIDAGTEGSRKFKRYFSINKNGEIIQYRDETEDSIDPTDEAYWWKDHPYRTGYLHISKNGEIKAQNYTNGYWRTVGRVLRGCWERDGPNGDIAHGTAPAEEDWELTEEPSYTIRLYAPEVGSQDTAFAMSIEGSNYTSELNPDGSYSSGFQYPFLLRYNGNMQCTVLTIQALSSGTGSTVVANSSGKLFKSSSSKRYKDYIADMTDEEAEKLYDLPVVRFKYKDGYLDMEDEMFDKPMHGFFAEDVADLFSDGGIHNTAGDVENYSERAIIARLVKLVQMQHREIEQLKQAVS